jgi:hypothetical protein
VSFTAQLSIGSASDKTAGPSVAFTVNQTVAAGKYVVVAIGVDNQSSTDGNTSEVSSVADSVGGNTYTKLREFCNSQGGSNSGATVALFGCVLVNGLTNTSVITATLANSKTASAITAQAYSIGAGATISIEGTPQDTATDGAAPSGITLSGLSSREYLFVLATASETDSSAGSVTSYTLNHAETGGGGGASNMGARLATRVLTGTGDTPTLVSFPSADHASIFLALKESSVVTVDLAGKVRA